MIAARIRADARRGDVPGAVSVGVLRQVGECLAGHIIETEGDRIIVLQFKQVVRIGVLPHGAIADKWVHVVPEVVDLAEPVRLGLVLEDLPGEEYGLEDVRAAPRAVGEDRGGRSGRALCGY